MPRAIIRIDYGKKAHQWSCSAHQWSNVLLPIRERSWHSTGCYFDKYHLPKHWFRPCNFLHSNSISLWQWLLSFFHSNTFIILLQWVLVDFSHFSFLFQQTVCGVHRRDLCVYSMCVWVHVQIMQWSRVSLFQLHPWHDMLTPRCSEWPNGVFHKRPHSSLASQSIKLHGLIHRTYKYLLMGTISGLYFEVCIFMELAVCGILTVTEDACGFFKVLGGYIYLTHQEKVCLENMSVAYCVSFSCM